MSHDAGRTCPCVADHRPVVNELEGHHIHPVYLGGAKDGELVFICPTAHTNAHELLRAWLAVGGPPPFEVVERYSRYARYLAAEGFRRWQAMTQEQP